MKDLAQSVEVAFNGMSLLLVFITVLFGIRYPTAIEFLNSPDGDPEKAYETRRRREKLGLFLIGQWTPLVVLSGIASYLLAPLATAIVATSRFSVWNFDIALTTYVFITMLLLMSFIWATALGLGLLAKWRRLKPTKHQKH